MSAQSYNFSLFDNITDNDLGINSSFPNVTEIVRPVVRRYIRRPLTSTELQLKELEWYIYHMIIPIIIIVGLLANFLSMYLIVKDNIKKSSNVLLMSLAFSDSANLIALIFIIVIRDISPLFFPYSTGVNYFLFYLYLGACFVLFQLGQFGSYTVPVLICFERLGAIFFPLKFHRLVTPLRTVVTLIVMTALFVAYCIAFSMTLTLGGPIPYRGMMIMYVKNADIFYRNRDVYLKLQRAVTELTGTVPMAFLLIGSIVIYFKVRAALRRRAQMTSRIESENDPRRASTSRTTRTLLIVCVTFLVLSIVYIYDVVRLIIRLPIEIGSAAESIKRMIIAINSSTNFIYILNNRKYRDQLKALFFKVGLSKLFPNQTKDRKKNSDK